MSAASAIRRGQAAAEREHTLTLTPCEPNGTTANGDGYQVPAFTEHDSIPGKFQAPTAAGKDTLTDLVRIGEVERPILRAGLHISITAPIPAAGRQRGIGWEYEVTAVGQFDDEALVGKRVLVVEVPSKSKATARRLDVVEVN